MPFVDRVVNLERDPTDSIFLNIAITCDADYLVSRDKDLLELNKDGFLLASYPKLKIVGPYDFLQAVREA